MKFKFQSIKQNLTYYIKSNDVKVAKKIYHKLEKMILPNSMDLKT